MPHFRLPGGTDVGPEPPDEPIEEEPEPTPGPPELGPAIYYSRMHWL